MIDQVLWDKIKFFTVDEGTPELGFIGRLSRDNNWSIAFSEQVYTEYLKFIYLMAVSDQHCTPSDEVDQVWHLHLCYSQSYWTDLCENLIGKKLHHGPTRGGSKESRRYQQQYEYTVKLLNQEFGKSRDENIWPQTAKRFKHADAFIRVNNASHFIVKKSKFVQYYIMFLVALTVMALVMSDTKIQSMLFVILGLTVLIGFLIWLAELSSRRQGRQNGNSGGGCGGAGCGGCGGCGG